MPIKIGNTGVVGIYLGNTEVIKKYVGSTLVYQKQSPSQLTLVPIGFKYSPSVSDYETTNETGTLVVVLMAGQNIGTITGTYTDSGNAFYKSQPLYIGNGNYAVVLAKRKGYTGGDDWGHYAMSMTFSSPNLSRSYTETTSDGYGQDHYGVPRVFTYYTRLGFTTFDIAPQAATTITKRIYGLAYDVTSIVGNNAYRYDEQWNEEVYQGYVVVCTTDAPSEDSGTMLSASISVQTKVSPLTINVSANIGSSARVGDVNLKQNGSMVIRHIVLQEGRNIRFCRINGRLVDGLSATYDSVMWDYSNLRVIDLSASGTIYTLSGKTLCFFDGIANYIEVTNNSGSVISPTIEVAANGTFANYNCNSSDRTINIRIL